MEQKSGKDLARGDILDTWCGQYTVTGFDPHPGLESYGTHYTARIARSGEWGMTIFDDDVWWMIEDGVWSTHPAEVATQKVQTLRKAARLRGSTSMLRARLAR